MKLRFIVHPEKGTEHGKWTGSEVYGVFDTQELNSPTLILLHETREAAQRHCDRLNDEEARRKE